MTLSIFEMMMNAGIVVKFVMLLLLFFSVMSWAIVLMKWIMFRRSKLASAEFLDAFWESKTFNDA